MELDDLREYCLSKAGVTESFPFGEETLVFKVGPKIFALVGLEDTPPRVNLKCEPARAIELRAEYPEFILPGYHMNKKHWNTVILDDPLDENLILEMVDCSYDLVFAGLSKREKQEIGEK